MTSKQGKSEILSPKGAKPMCYSHFWKRRDFGNSSGLLASTDFESLSRDFLLKNLVLGTLVSLSPTYKRYRSLLGMKNSKVYDHRL